MTHRKKASAGGKYNTEVILKWVAEHRLFPVAEYLFDDARKWRFDFALPDARVALEVERDGTQRFVEYG